MGLGGRQQAALDALAQPLGLSGDTLLVYEALRVILVLGELSGREDEGAREQCATQLRERRRAKEGRERLVARHVQLRVALGSGSGYGLRQGQGHGEGLGLEKAAGTWWHVCAWGAARAVGR